MNHFFRLCLISFLTVCSFNSYAETSTSSDKNNALDQLVSRLSKITTFSGSFIQYAVDQKGTRIQESKGQLKADRSGLFFWQTTAPLEQIVVSNGKEVTVYDPDLDQATIQEVGQQAQTTPAILFSGDTKTIGENYFVESKTQVANSVQYLLKPKNKESLFDKLVVRFEGDSIQELRITDALGQESTMSFVETKINPVFSSDTFTLKLPKGTDIIRDVPTR